MRGADIAAAGLFRCFPLFAPAISEVHVLRSPAPRGLEARDLPCPADSAPPPRHEGGRFASGTAMRCKGGVRLPAAAPLVPAGDGGASLGRARVAHTCGDRGEAMGAELGAAVTMHRRWQWRKKASEVLWLSGRTHVQHFLAFRSLCWWPLDQA